MTTASFMSAGHALPPHCAPCVFIGDDGISAAILLLPMLHIKNTPASERAIYFQGTDEEGGARRAGMRRYEVVNKKLL